ncbi:hypothetical protein KC19_7G066600 [Ceratodon purpureus]|uniref:Uncharacterized protein n=1 Tax=Ceratodon purpureus TaxID=3225 RepID=A0A8T0H6R7_CERPU|nr:hypothetical protein KC19_7G066600 [Ceratodon purpureus]
MRISFLSIVCFRSNLSLLCSLMKIWCIICAGKIMYGIMDLQDDAQQLHSRIWSEVFKIVLTNCCADVFSLLMHGSRCGGSYVNRSYFQNVISRQSHSLETFLAHSSCSNNKILIDIL